MPNEIIDKKIHCPHCGHNIRISVDSSSGDQNYYDECPACCRDIHLEMHVDEAQQKIQLAVDSDDEQVF